MQAKTRKEANWAEEAGERSCGRSRVEEVSQTEEASHAKERAEERAEEGAEEGAKEGGEATWGRRGGNPRKEERRQEEPKKEGRCHSMSPTQAHSMSPSKEIWAKLRRRDERGEPSQRKRGVRGAEERGTQAKERGEARASEERGEASQRKRGGERRGADFVVYHWKPNDSFQYGALPMNKRAIRFT